MQLDDRSTMLLKEIVRCPGLKSKDLEQKYALSRRQVGYSLERMNAWLEECGLPRIEKNRQGVLLVDAKLLLIDQDKTSANAYAYIVPEAQRVDLILLLLVSRNEEISLVHLTSALKVSKNTILSDLKTAQKNLADYSVEIDYSRQCGYRLRGNEFDKRKLLIDLVHRILKMYQGAQWIRKFGAITEDEIQKFRQRLENIELTLQLRFTDERIESTALTLLLILRRLRQNKIIGAFHIGHKELSDTDEYKAVEELLVDEKNVPTDERLYLTLQLLTANRSSSDLLSEQTIPRLMEAIEQMLKKFESLSCVELTDRDALLEKLLLHIKPAYYRIKYKLTLSGTLQDRVIRDTFFREFKDVYRLLKKSLTPLESLLGCVVPEDEIVYITMIVGGWMQRQGGRAERKVQALVVCPNGVSISKLLQVTLREVFPEFGFQDAISVREFSNYDRPYDLVFSSVRLATDKKVFIVNPVIEAQEKARLRAQVMQELYGYSFQAIRLEKVMEIIEKHALVKDRRALVREIETYLSGARAVAASPPASIVGAPDLCDLLAPGMIRLDVLANDWEDAIRLAAEPLEQGEFIEQRYAEHIVERYRKQFPHIIFGTDIAIPHGIPEDGVKKVGMSLVQLRNPVRFSNFSVRLVVLVAAVDRRTHLGALLQLAKLAESKRDIRALLEARGTEEISKVFRKYQDDKIGKEESLR